MDFKNYAKEYKAQLETVLFTVWRLLQITTAIWFFKIGYQLSQNFTSSKPLMFLAGGLAAYLGASVVDDLSRRSLVFSINAESNDLFRSKTWKDPEKRFVTISKIMGFSLLLLSGVFTLMGNSLVADMIFTDPPIDLVETKITAFEENTSKREKSMKEAIILASRSVRDAKREGHQRVNAAIQNGAASWVKLWKENNGWIRVENNRRKYSGMIRYREGIEQAKSDSANTVNAALANLAALNKAYSSYQVTTAESSNKVTQDAAMMETALFTSSISRDRMVQLTLGCIDLLWVMIIVAILYLLRLVGGVSREPSPYSVAAIASKAGMLIHDHALGAIDTVIDRGAKKEIRSIKFERPKKKSTPGSKSTKKAVDIPVVISVEEPVDIPVVNDEEPTTTVDKNSMQQNDNSQGATAEIELSTGQQLFNRIDNEFDNGNDNGIDNGKSVVIDGQTITRTTEGEVAIRHTTVYANGKKKVKDYTLHECQRTLSAYRSKIKNRSIEIDSLNKKLSNAGESERAHILKKLQSKKKSKRDYQDKALIWVRYVAILKERLASQSS